MGQPINWSTLANAPTHKVFTHTVQHILLEMRGHSILVLQYMRYAVLMPGLPVFFMWFYQQTVATNCLCHSSRVSCV